MNWGRIALVLPAAVSAAIAIAAVRPGGIAAAQPGVWRVSRDASGNASEQVCLADPAFLAQWEGRASTCTRTPIVEDANQVTFDFKCGNGAFGRSKMTLLTPRSLRIETQGISGGAPFEYQLFARRTGTCPRR